ncbi:hypothetical protein SAMN04489760_1476 [Syntrophus gentianae]|uniref:Uncharacterized protein n=1 Tax=Syntrophus gentianae TaxID=43775 RepID=A0A1H8B6L6_9BACT|nr:hypothetical protein [Syntrophus gentianae]SEM78406.1 hypothetical protein SAMN04489760_1476 [Syntrophus gentianae]
MKARTFLGFDKIDKNGFDLLKKILGDQEGNSLFLKLLIAIAGLIQSHTQGWTGSATLRQHKPYRMDLLDILQELLDFFSSFF